MMSAIYDEHKDDDGFLYMTYSGENTFGDNITYNDEITYDVLKMPSAPHIWHA